MAHERNLLFGVLAVQLKLATPNQLVDAGAIWAANRERGLGEILLELGALNSRQRQLIDDLLSEQVDAHAGDAAATLEAFGGSAAVHESFAASFVYDAQAGVKYQSIGGETPEPGKPGERVLSDQEQLTTEHPGRYTIKREKGRGGVGRVLIVYDEHVGREIALKELLPDSSASTTPAVESPMRKSATLTARFLREARVTGQLEHPGIVPVYEVGRRSDDTTYYTMKLVRGGTLAERLKRCRGIGDRLKLLPHFLDLCQAIAYAHSRGVIHRDIKPGNVMIGEFGETVLLDWGLAKVKGQKDEGAEKIADEIRLLKETEASETVAGKPIGTPSYMSPEQADGLIDRIDERSDVWSLGAVLYEILTGKPPYTGITALDVIGKVLTDPVVPIRKVAKDAPGELSAVTECCLERDHRRRYQHVEQLAEDVAAFQTGGLVSAYTYSAAKIIVRWSKRHWAVLATATLALAVLLSVAGVAWTRVNAEKNHAEALVLKLRGVNLANAGLDQLEKSRFECASLLTLQAAEVYGQASNWMPEVDNAFRALLSSDMYRHNELYGHESTVISVAFSPDGTLLASGSGDKTIRLWEPHNPAVEPAVLHGHESGVGSVAFSPDGTLLASGSGDKTIRLWDLSDLSAEPIVLQGHGDAVHAVAFSPDGSLLASGSQDKTLRVWHLSDPAAEPAVLRGHEDAVWSVAFSPNGTLLTSGSGDNTIRLWDLSDRAAEPAVLQGHEDVVYAVAFSPDGSLLASGSQDKTLRVWHLSDPAAEPVVLRRYEDTVIAIAFSPDGSLLAAGGWDRAISLWDLSDPAAEPAVLPAQGHEAYVISLAFSPDSNLLAAGSHNNTLRVWDLSEPSAEPAVLRGHEHAVFTVAFSPDGMQLASGSWDYTIRLWDLSARAAEPAVLRGHEDFVWSVAFSPDGNLLASGGDDRSIRLWNMRDPAAEPVVLQGHDDAIYGVAFSPDGTLLASVGGEKTIRLWDLSDLGAQPVLLMGHNTDAYLVAFSPDGGLLASVGTDGTAYLWDLSDPGAEPAALRGHTDIAWCVAFSPDGTLLASGSRDRTIRLWDMRDPAAGPVVLQGHDDAIYAVAFSPDCSLLASGSWDHTIRLWDLSDLAAAPAVLRGHEGAVESVAFSPDERLLATSGRDCTIRLWHWRMGDIAEMAKAQVNRNLTWQEWQTFVGKVIPYEKTIPDLPLGYGVPYEGAIASEINGGN